MNPMRVTLMQADIVWKDKEANLRRLRERLEELRGKTDLVVLPESFATGFDPEDISLAETNEGFLMAGLRRMAADTGLAVAGTFLACDPGTFGADGKNAYYNRAFFMPGRLQDSPSFYDKRHLFSIGGEAKYLQKGQERVCLAFKGWNICMQVCYDLRFPVWSRNYQGEPYHLLIYMANWPASRRQAWDLLLPARAVENYSYVCAVNRVGTDPNGLKYDGGSAAYSYMGEELARVPDGQEGCVTITLDGDRQEYFRRHCPMWRDMDKFGING